MSRPPTPPPRSADAADALLCEIHAPRAVEATPLADIVALCARDVGLAVQVKPVRPAPSAGGAPARTVLTLHLPVELAAGRHPVWCLACRLACFLPDARVSVLIQGAAFASPRRSRRRRAA